MSGLLLFALLVVLQAADGWTTYQLIKRGGYERNPVVRAIFERLGTYPGLIVSKGTVLVLAYFLTPEPNYLAGLVAAYSYVAWRNWHYLRK